jgi:hypothetical protein
LIIILPQASRTINDKHAATKVGYGHTGKERVLMFARLFCGFISHELTSSASSESIKGKEI